MTVRKGLPSTALFVLALAALSLPAHGQNPPPPQQQPLVQKWAAYFESAPDKGHHVKAVAVDAAGNVVVTGLSTGHPEETGSQIRYYTAKFSGHDGTLLWSAHCRADRDFSSANPALAVDSAGNVIITGPVSQFHDDNPNSSPDSDYYTAKYAAADGALLWEKTYNGNGTSSSRTDIPVAVAVDAAGDVVVTGTSDIQVGHTFYTVKYAGADGALVWERRTEISLDFSHQAAALVLDKAGNAIVTGRRDFAGGPDCYTVKYSAAAGDVMWERGYHSGPGLTYEAGRAVTVDSQGNVLVAAAAEGPDQYYDFYTAKYAAADGALLWEKRTPATSDWQLWIHSPSAIAVDSQDNVIVNGSVGHSFSTDCLTVKHAAADGAVLWSKRYDGPLGRFDDAAGVIVDAADNVIVAVSTPSPFVMPLTSDFFLIKYSPAGAVLCERRYHGPSLSVGNYFSSRRSLAVTPEGGVAVAGNGLWTESAPYRDFIVLNYAPPGLILPSWRRNHFGSTGNAGPGADTADPDQDGIPNLIEWACGLDPVSPGAMEMYLWLAPEGQFFEFATTFNPAALDAGAVFDLEWSDSLTAPVWHSTESTIQTASSSNGYHSLTLRTPAGTGKRFFRLRITAPPAVP